MTTDLYSLLGVDRDATAMQLKDAFRKLSKKYHPDTGGITADPKKFDEAKTAYEVLKDPARRKRYDRTGRTDEVKVTPSLIQSMIQNTVVAMVSAQRSDGSTDDPGWEDIRSKVLSTIRNGRREVTANLKEANRKLQRLDNLAKRFKSKTKEDPVGEAFAEHRATLVKELETQQDALELNHKMEEVFKSYEYEVEPGPEGHFSPDPTARLGGPVHSGIGISQRPKR